MSTIGLAEGLVLFRGTSSVRIRFGGITSGTCPTCETFIQVNLGKHVALYYLDLAQLWRCPVDWCPVWKGTSQDCVDHMRRAHNTPISVKVGTWRDGSHHGQSLENNGIA